MAHLKSSLLPQDNPIDGLVPHNIGSMQEAIDSAGEKVQANEKNDSSFSCSTSLKRYGNDDNTVINKKKRVLCDENELYDASGLKATQHGVLYQLKLLMLFAKRCQKNGYSFRLATEMDDAEKFDDVVLEYIIPNDNRHHFMFLQAKHIQKESEQDRKITAHDLLTELDDLFSLQKYFASYQKIKRNKKFQLGNHAHFVINTNIDFDFHKDDLNLDIKNLAPLYFEPVNAATTLVDVGGKYYQIVGSKYSEERQSVVSTLKSVFEETSEFKKLALALSQHLVDDSKIIGLDKLFKKYRTALVKEVLNINDNKLSNKFIEGDHTLSPKAQCFREAIREAVEKLLNEKKLEKRSEMDKKLLAVFNDEKLTKIPKLAVQKIEPFWDLVGKIDLRISPGFKDIIVLTENPQLKDSLTFAKQIAHLIVSKIKTLDKKIYIRKVKENSLIPEIYQFAGHVLVEKNDTIVFSQTFLMGNGLLAGDIASFRIELIKELENKKITLDKLHDYSFKITDFETCQEEEFAELLATKPVFPEYKITQ